MLGVADVLVHPEEQQHVEEDVGGDPFSWEGSLSTGAPLLYSGMLRWQASALQVSENTTIGELI